MKEYLLNCIYHTEKQVEVGVEALKTYPKSLGLVLSHDSMVKRLKDLQGEAVRLCYAYYNESGEFVWKDEK